jgi:hypothetical protein
MPSSEGSHTQSMHVPAARHADSFPPLVQMHVAAAAATAQPQRTHMVRVSLTVFARASSG